MLQREFEQLAMDIMANCRTRMNRETNTYMRKGIIDNMKLELLAPKSAYEGVISFPITEETFAETLNINILKS